MKVKKIYPCVCIKEDPEEKNLIDYGMPDLAVSQITNRGNIWMSAYCRNCGRGDRWMNQKSAYYALKYWNEIQKTCWSVLCTDIGGNRKPEVKDWQWRIFEETRNETVDI